MKILVLGGGISGLSAARLLSQLYPYAEITLLEKTNRLGGWIETEDTGSFLFERGPRTFSAARSPSLLQLISEVGLESELLFSRASAKKRYLWHRNKLKSAGALFLPHAWRLFREPFIEKGSGDETIHSFAVRRFGKKIADLFFDPITLGVFAGDCRTLSVGACFPRFVEMEQRYGSLVLGMLASRKVKKKKFPGSLFTLKRGMQSLVDAIVEQLNIEIITDVEIEFLYKSHGQWKVETKSGSFSADVVFSALPAHALRALLPDMPEISSSSLSLVNLGFLQKPKAAKAGYGYLVPSNQENESLLGMIWDSEVFGGSCRMTAMVRGDAASPTEVALDALRRHLRIRQLPDRLEVHRAEEAIAQLEVGQKEKLLSWEQSLQPGLYLTGNYIEGAAVEQCISRSEKVVYRNHLKNRF
jgi:oxygen-dependent protoporphyrinogen oxidase